ncbi:MAG: hypothetical protein QF380_06890, partial [Candidatus Marinimicrobia bacterium]|nr:hypothetical protein [Candidatus Neomarinimicrobiota bacterium]
MVDIITVIISLIIGITIGWILKSFSQPKSENTNQDIITHLTEEKARAEAKLEQMEEIKDGMETVFKSLAGEITNNNTEAFLKLAGD